MYIKIRNSAAAAVLSCSLLSVGIESNAQQAEKQFEKQPDAEQEPQKVIVQGQKSESSGGRDVVAGKIILGREWLDRTASSTIAEALRRESSVSVGSNGKISLKGLPGYTQILLDGQPVSGSGNPLEMDPSLIDRVEIIHSASADSGPFGLAGTINVITRSRRKALPKQVSLNVGTNGLGGKGSMSLQGGWREPTGTTFNITADATKARSGQHGEATWSFENKNGMASASAESTETWILNESVSIAPSLTWKPTQVDEFQLRGSLSAFKLGQDSSSTLTNGAPFVAGGIRPDSTQSADFIKANSAAVSSNWRHQLANGGNWTANISLTQERQKNNRGANTIWSPNLANQLNVAEDSVKDFLNGRWDLALANHAGHKVRFSFSSQLESRTVDRKTVVNGVSETGDQLGPYSAKLRSVSNAVWLQDDWKVSEALDIKVGFRQERSMMRFASGEIQTRLAANLAAPSFNLAWKLDPEGERTVTLDVARRFSSIGPAMLNPRPEIAGISLCSPNGGCGANDPNTPDWAGNPALKYENGWGLDASLENQFGKESIWSLRAYHRRINDTLAWVTQREIVPWANVPRWVHRPRNVGNATAFGLTFGLDTYLVDWMEQAPNLGINASVQWNQSRISTLPGPDNRLEKQQPWSGRLSFSYKLSDKPIELHTDLLINPANWWQASTDRRIYTATRKTVSAKAIWTVAPQRRLIISLDDLLASDSRDLTQFAGGTALQTTSRQFSRTTLSVRLESRFN